MSKDVPGERRTHNGARLERETFCTSRLADLTSVKALTAIAGLRPEYWPLVVFKELADNGIDNAEADTAPKIIIAVTDDAITVTDNGAGMASPNANGRLPTLSSPSD